MLLEEKYLFGKGCVERRVGIDINDDGGLVVQCLDEEGRNQVRVLHTGRLH